MKGYLNKNGHGPLTVVTDKGEFMLHKDSFGRYLKDMKHGQEIDVELSTEGCPYDYTSRCTSPNCDCDTKKYAKKINLSELAKLRDEKIDSILGVIK